jgi:isopentenyl-diphosphate delta-isomerase
MDNTFNTQNRKSDHIRINLDENVHSGVTNGFEKYFFVHNALPELALGEVNTRLSFFDKSMQLPLLISSMTGGAVESERINRNLAIAAQETGIAMGLGSMRVALEDKNAVKSFLVRQYAPNIPLFANLGAVQLNYGYSVKECRKAVEMVGADGLILHLNPLQEALQPEGQTNFAGLLQKIEVVCHELEVPVIVKEVGWGISEAVARKLKNAGVAALDVAGAGGTSWSQVEMFRSRSETDARISGLFVEWGIPTAESIRMVRRNVEGLPIIASGGITNGLELAKSMALGATLGGMAGRFLKAAVVSEKEVIDLVREIEKELRIAMFAVGAGTLEALHNTPLTQDVTRRE